MAETEGMAALRRYEDSRADVLATMLDDGSTALWPLARWPIARTIAQADLGTKPVPERVAAPAGPRSLRNRLGGVWDAVRRNPWDVRHAPRADDLFVVAGWTRVATSDGYRNWLTDDFAAAVPSSIVLQDAPLDVRTHGAGVPVNPRTFSFAPALDRVREQTAAHPLPAAEHARITRAVEHAFAEIDFDVPAELIRPAVDDVLRRAARAPFVRQAFARVMDRVRPERIYMQTAAYGDRASEIAEAHRRGIAVIELQHGWVGPSHAAYNMGAAMFEHPLVDHLPDTMYTFGEHWHEGLRFPGRLVAVGKPDLEAQATRAPAFAERDKRVLFVSGNRDHELASDVVLGLRDALGPDWSVRVRPHPIERDAITENFPRLAEQRGIEFDLHDAPLDAIAAARGVVGFASTMLYEALPLGAHVAVVESGLSDFYADATSFPLRIIGPEDLATTVAVFTGDAPAPPGRERVWARDPAETFARLARR